MTCTLQPRGCWEFVGSLGLLFYSDACGYLALWVSSLPLQMVPSIFDQCCHLLMTWGFRLFVWLSGVFSLLLALHVVVQVHIISLYKQLIRNFIVIYLYMHNPMKLRYRGLAAMTPSGSEALPSWSCWCLNARDMNSPHSYFTVFHKGEYTVVFFLGRYFRSQYSFKRTYP